MVGIDNDLTKDEYIPIFRASLDFSVIERVEQVLKKITKLGLMLLLWNLLSS